MSNLRPQLCPCSLSSADRRTQPVLSRQTGGRSLSSAVPQQTETGGRQAGQTVGVDGDLHVSEQNVSSVAVGDAHLSLQVGEPLEDELVLAAPLKTPEVQKSNQMLPAAGGQEQ